MSMGRLDLACSRDRVDPLQRCCTESVSHALLFFRTCHLSAGSGLGLVS